MITRRSTPGFSRSVPISILVGLLALSAPATAGMVDTLTGLTPGDVIGCDYTFQNGDPSIPCAKDTVGADGTVSFLKPNAPYDNLEYFDITTGKDISEILDPPGTPINSQLTFSTDYPLLQVGGSFFDVFVTLDLPDFNDTGLEKPGAIHVGETFDFTDGTSPGLPDVSIPGFTGTATVSGFDEVSGPEPGTILLAAAGLALCLLVRVAHSR